MTNKEAFEIIVRATEPGVQITRNGYYQVELAIMKLAELVKAAEEKEEKKE